MSNGGEMAGDTFDLVEWITGNYLHSCRFGGSNYCGRKPKVMAAEFRERFKTGLQAITAKGIGRIMATTGYYAAWGSSA